MSPSVDAKVLTGLWNRALGDRFPLRVELARQFLSIHVDPTLSSADEQKAMVVKRHGEGAWIAALAVDPAAQRRGVGRSLLSSALAALRADGVAHVQLGADHLHLLPGVPDPGSAGFFAGQGAALDPAPVFDLRRDLGAWAPPRTLPEVEPAADWVEVLDFLRREFPGRWLWAAEEERRRGHGPEGYLLLREAGSVVGFVRVHGEEQTPLIGPSLYWSPLLASRRGGLGPIGIAENMRGRGLGLGLLHAGMAHLKRHGVRDMVIDWTSLASFYGKAGFAPWRQYRTGSFDLSH